MKIIITLALFAFISVAVIATEESTVTKVIEQQKVEQQNIDQTKAGQKKYESVSPENNVNEQAAVLSNNTTKATINETNNNKRFIPSEEISEDLGVSFPTDI